MKVYRSENRLTIDNCAQFTKELQNKSVEDRQLANFYYTNDCKCEVLDDFLFDNNMVVKDGYGFTNGCSVDADSELRINGSGLTHDKEKIQLCARVNTGGPNINKGGLIPNIDSRLKNAEDTSRWRSCDKISEHDFDRWVPFVGCLAPTIQNPDYIIPPFVRGGVPTRWDVRSTEYLNKCGFENNGKNWVRKQAN
jgi:hypothetical protein